MFCDKCGNKIEVKKSKAVPILIGLIVFLVIIIAVLGILLITLKPKTKCETQEGGNQVANSTSEVQLQESTTKKIGGDTVAVDMDLSNVTAKPENDKARTQNIEFLNAFYKHDKNEKYGKTTMLLKNNNDTMVDVNIYINFYKDGQRIGSESGSGYNIKANHLFVEEVTVDFNEEYDSVDITYSADKSKSSYEDIEVDNSKIKSMKDGNDIVATYERPYNKDTSYWAYIIYKKDGKIVYCDQTVDSSLNETETAGFKFFLYNYKDLQYDDYEIKIYSASKRVSY